MWDGNIENGPASRPGWEHLEEWLRGQMQGLIRDLFEQEVTEFLGRARSVRRSESDNDAGYRNGYAPPRRLTLSSGTIRIRRPRVRDTEERFESRLLPLFAHRTREVADRRVGRRRVAPIARSTFPSAPLRTVRDTFASYGSPVVGDAHNSFGVPHHEYLHIRCRLTTCPPSPCAGLSPARTTTRAP